MFKAGLIVGFIYALATLPSSWQLGTDAFARAGLYWSHIFVCVIVGGMIGAILKSVIKLGDKILYDAKMRRIYSEEKRRKIHRDFIQSRKEFLESISGRITPHRTKTEDKEKDKSGCPEWCGKRCSRDDFYNYGSGMENTLCPRADEYRRNRGH